MSRSRHLLIAGLAAFSLAAATLGVFMPVAGHPFHSLDDQAYVTRNPRVQAGLTREGVAWAFTSLYQGNWHPLTWMSHMLDVELFGADAGGHHLVNVGFHAANAVILFLALFRMTGAPWRSGFVAALFAVHPLHVESVAWVAERKDVLCAFFWLLAMGAYARYAERPGIGRSVPVVLLYALGLLSKPMAVTFPFTLLLLDYWPLARLDLSRRASLRSAVLEKLPLFLLSGASCVITYVAQREAGVVAPTESLRLGVRAANAVVSYVTYLGKTIWPASLSVFYPHPGTFPPWYQVLGSAAVLLGLTWLASRDGRRSPAVAVGWLWYLGTLVPVIGIVQIGVQAMADRYTYLPLLGPFVAAAWGLPQAARGRRVAAGALAPAAAAVLIAMAVVAHERTCLWRSSVVLLQDALAVGPDHWLTRTYLGTVLVEEERLDDAVPHLVEAIRSNPDDAPARVNLGWILLKRGRPDDAEAQFREAVRAMPNNAEAHYNLGLVVVGQGKTGEAIVHYREALRIWPEHVAARNNLANALLQQGLAEAAAIEYRKALEIDPGNATIHYNLGVVLYRLGDIGAAMAGYREALRIAPGFSRAHTNLGNVLLERGIREEAAAHFREALRMDPEDPVARRGLDAIREGGK